MAEEEVNYASVVFKTKTHSSTAGKKQEETVYDEVRGHNQTTQQAAEINGKKEEETVYDEVRGHNQTTQQAADIDTGLLPDKKDTKGCFLNQKLACFLGIICVILVLGIIAVIVFLSLNGNESELKQLRENQTALLEVNRNLTDHNDKLTSDNKNLRRDFDNLTVVIGDLRQSYNVSQSKLTSLTEENKALNTQIQDLETERNNLTQQIQDMMTQLKEPNVTAAQWSIDAYCPKEGGVRQCQPCEKGWLHHQSSCFVFHNAKALEQKTWEESRENCRRKNSDLPVVVNEDEKKFISDNSFGSSGTNGYWIGLRVEDRTWKWINGSDLTENSWKPQPTDNGRCAISVRNDGWKSVICAEKKQWICKRMALTV